MKKWTKKARKFINPSHECLAAVSWDVSFLPGDPKSRNKWFRKHSVDANFCVTDEGRNHYVTKEADLRAIRKMIVELEAFEHYCKAAFLDKQAAEDDAKS